MKRTRVFRSVVEWGVFVLVTLLLLESLFVS